MTQDEYARKIEELDRLLNDPDVPMDPSRVWSLLADLSDREAGPAALCQTRDAVPLASAPAGGSAD